MTQNWYAVYTKPQKERKVVVTLTKKGIEHFCPICNLIDSKSVTMKQVGFEPLLSSYIFVFIPESELYNLKAIPGVSNIIYFKSKPAVINHKEIDIMKQLATTYSSIKLEKAPVNINGSVRLVGDPIVSYGDNSVSLRHQAIKIYLPTLGFTITAERTKPKEQIFYNQVREQQTNLLSLFPKRLNAFFFT